MTSKTAVPHGRCLQHDCEWQPDLTCGRRVDLQAAEHVRKTGHATVHGLHVPDLLNPPGDAT